MRYDMYYVYDAVTDLPACIADSPKEVASFIGCHLATVYRILNQDRECNGYKVLVIPDDDSWYTQVSGRGSVVRS